MSEWEEDVDDAFRHLLGESSGWSFDNIDGSGRSANLNFTSNSTNSIASLNTSATNSQQAQSSQTASFSTPAPLQPPVSATSYGSQQPPGPSYRRSTQPTFSTRGLAPVSERAEFTENWLDLRQAPAPDDFDYIAGIPVAIGVNDPPQASPRSESSPGFDDIDMPVTTRSRGQRASVVDLTAEQSSSAENRSSRPSANVKRPATESGSHNRSPKRSRTGGLADVEELDLTGDPPTVEEEVLQDQQAKAIAAQDGDQAGPVKIFERTCNICMETLTDATVTSCGHMYCHECLTQALIASERSTANPMGKCPNCRKALSRKKAHNMIPISFLKKSAFKTKGRPSMSGSTSGSTSGSRPGSKSGSKASKLG